MLSETVFGLFSGACACGRAPKYRTKRVFALLTPEIRGLKMAQMPQKPVFALPGCQRTSVNTLLCDTLGLADTFLTRESMGCHQTSSRHRTTIATTRDSMGSHQTSSRHRTTIEQPIICKQQNLDLVGLETQTQNAAFFERK